jgi:hypothetical protein
MVLGLLALLALFGAASYWQGTWTESVREERQSLRDELPPDRQEREAGWGNITIGRPSGAAPVDLPEPAPVDEQEQDRRPFLTKTMPGAPGGPPGASHEPAAEMSPPPADFEYKVPEGRVLSKICEEFYGSGRDPIPGTVATYNGLSSPDQLRAGQVLKLPDWNVLFPGKARP